MSKIFSILSRVQMVSPIVICAGVLFYMTVIVDVSDHQVIQAMLFPRHAEQKIPHLWRDIWKDTWNYTDALGPLVVCLALLFLGFALLWRNIPALCQPQRTFSTCALLCSGGLTFSLGAIAIFGNIWHADPENDPYSLFGGQGLFASCLIYLAALVLLTRAIPLVACLFEKPTDVLDRFLMLAILFMVLSALALGVICSDESIELYTAAKYWNFVGTYPL